MASAGAWYRNEVLTSNQISPSPYRESSGYGAGMAQGHRKRSAPATTSSGLIPHDSTLRRIGFSEARSCASVGNRLRIHRMALFCYAEKHRFRRRHVAISQLLLAADASVRGLGILADCGCPGCRYASVRGLGILADCGCPGCLRLPSCLVPSA